MAGSDFFDELAKKPTGYKLGLLFLPILLGGLVYWQLFYVDIADQVSSLESRQQNLLLDQRNLDKDIEDQKRLVQRIEQIEQSIRINQRALPTQPELSAFFDFLQRRAGEAGITIRKWEQLDPETVDIYVRVPVQIEISGDFLSVVRYFYLLGPRRQDASGDDDIAVTGDRIVSIEDLYLSQAESEDGESRLVGTFIASTFHLDDAAGKAGAGAGGQPRGGTR